MFADPRENTSTMQWDNDVPVKATEEEHPRGPVVNSRRVLSAAERDRRIAQARAKRRARHVTRRNRK